MSALPHMISSEIGLPYELTSWALGLTLKERYFMLVDRKYGINDPHLPGCSGANAGGRWKDPCINTDLGIGRLVSKTHTCVGCQVRCRNLRPACTCLTEAFCVIT